MQGAGQFSKATLANNGLAWLRSKTERSGASQAGQGYRLDRRSICDGLKPHYAYDYLGFRKNYGLSGAGVKARRKRA